MINENIINNINLDKLPDDVQHAMFDEFIKLTIQQKLIVLSKITHGSLFRVSPIDLFKINKVPVNKVYDNYINNVKHAMLDNGF